MAEERAVYIAPARAARFRVVGHFFQSRVAESIARNATRSGAARVPDKAIGGTSRRLELPSRAEGFDQLFFVRLDPERGFVVEEWRDARGPAGLDLCPPPGRADD